MGIIWGRSTCCFHLIFISFICIFTHDGLFHARYGGTFETRIPLCTPRLRLLNTYKIGLTRKMKYFINNFRFLTVVVDSFTSSSQKHLG